MTSKTSRHGRVPALIAACGALLLLQAPPARSGEPPALPEISTLSGTYLAARHAAAQQRYGEAARFLGEALASDPANDDLIRGAFSLSITAGDLDTACALAQRILAEAPEDNLALSVLLLQDIKTGGYAAALDKLSHIQTAGLSRLIVPLIRSWAAIGLGDRTAALAALDGLAAQDGFAPMSVLHRAMILDYAGDAAGADAAFADALAAGRSSRLVELAGGFYERAGETERARALYADFLASHPGDLASAAALARLAAGGAAPAAPGPAEGVAQALYGIASLIAQQGMGDTALVYARFVPFLDPGLAQGQVLIAGLLDQSGQHEAALQLYRAIGDGGGPLAWRANLDAAKTLGQLGRRDEAIRLLTAMAAQQPDRGDVLIAMGDLYRGAGDFQRAIQSYDAASDRPATTGWLLLYKRAMALQALDQWDRAQSDLEAALRLNPDQASLLNTLGYFWVDQGRNLSEALAMIQRAHQQRPDDGAITDSLGWAYYRLGRYDEAVATLERAVLAEPEDQVINDHLGDAYWMVGRRLEAGFQWRRALRDATDPADVARLEAKLANGLAEPVPAQQAAGRPGPLAETQPGVVSAAYPD